MVDINGREIEVGDYVVISSYDCGAGQSYLQFGNVNIVWSDDECEVTTIFEGKESNAFVISSESVMILQKGYENLVMS